MVSWKKVDTVLLTENDTAFIITYFRLNNIYLAIPEIVKRLDLVYY